MAEITLYDYEDDYGYSNCIGEGNLTATVVVPQIEALKGQHIDFKVASIGGRVTDALAIYNALLAHGDVTTINMGYALSSGGFICMAGKDRKTYASSLFMLHNASLFKCDNMNAEDMRQAASALDVVDNIMTALFVEHTGLPEDEIKAMLASETWLSGADAAQMGFFTEVIQVGETKAIAQASYNNIITKAPKQMVAYANKSLIIAKSENMDIKEEITAIKAQNEENTGLLKWIKDTLGITAKAEDEVVEETVEDSTEETEEVVEGTVDVEALKAENEGLKAQLAEAQNQVTTAKAQITATNETLKEIKSNYKPADKTVDFNSKENKDAPTEISASAREERRKQYKNKK